MSTCSDGIAVEKYMNGCGLSIKNRKPGTVSLELWFPQRPCQAKFLT